RGVNYDYPSLELLVGLVFFNDVFQSV
ncbi:MAG: hypothetical protein ACI814_003477, partial [Mariniblastus sp.]